MRLEVPPGHLFGLANLPYGVYSVAGSDPRVCTRYGDHVIDLATLLGDGVFAHPSLNGFMARGHDHWVRTRADIAHALDGLLPADAVHPVDAVRLHLPFEARDYVDFYASEHHAANLGRMFRPDSPDPLTPNWRHLPIGYHGRAGSIVVSGTDVVRPSGQLRAGVFGPCERLDIEAELGFVVGTPSPIGTPIPVAEAEHHLFGAFLFNDWSARDIQAWEYVPLGPHLGKSFASTISPWVVPMLALEDAKVATPPQDPVPLPYLALEEPWTLDIALEVEWNGQVVSRPPYATQYWSPAQMLAHLTSNGAPTRTGDVFASGTISGPEPDQVGSLIELGRGFLVDGDEVVLTGVARTSSGARLGFGEARGRIVPA